MAAVKCSKQEQEGTPPHVGVKMIQDDRVLRRMGELIEPRNENQQAVHHQRDADEEPDRDGTLRIHGITRK